jgi:hypothetical protein
MLNPCRGRYNAVKGCHICSSERRSRSSRNELCLNAIHLHCRLRKGCGNRGMTRRPNRVRGERGGVAIAPAGSRLRSRVDFRASGSAASDKATPRAIGRGMELELESSAKWLVGYAGACQTGLLATHLISILFCVSLLSHGVVGACKGP